MIKIERKGPAGHILWAGEYEMKDFIKMFYDASTFLGMEILDLTCKIPAEKFYGVWGKTE